MSQNVRVDLIQMNIRKGYIRLMNISGVPLYVHWSVPLLAIIIQLYYDREFTTGPIFILSYLFLIIWHEIGHFFFAKLFCRKVYGLELIGFGGYCYWEATDRLNEEFLIISGGLIFQFILFLFAVAFIYFVGNTEFLIVNCMLVTFSVVNIVLIIINLFPSKKTDGRKLFILMYAMFKQKSLKP
jgi:hypothetical protein